MNRTWNPVELSQYLMLVEIAINGRWGFEPQDCNKYFRRI